MSLLPIKNKSDFRLQLRCPGAGFRRGNRLQRGGKNNPAAHDGRFAVADGGEIRLFGKPIRRFRDWERIGYVPQKNAFNPLFPATVREVVLSGLYNNKKLLRRIGREEQRKCDDALEVMRIGDLAGKRIGQLSGGQQQRVFGPGAGQQTGFACAGRADRRDRRPDAGRFF